MTLYNIVSSADAEARQRKGLRIYANTDGDAAELWLDASGARRRPLAPGTYIGPLEYVSRDTNTGRMNFFGFKDGTWIAVTNAAIEATGNEVAPDVEVKEQLLLTLQRDRVTAHNLLALEATIRTLRAQGQAVPADVVLQAEQLTARLRSRQDGAAKAGWLSRTERAFDSAWASVLRTVGIGALPVVPLVVAGVLIIGGLGLAAWLSSAGPQSVTDLRASLDLYNRVRGALPAAERQNLDTLITSTADAAAEQAAPGFFDQLQGALMWLVVGAAVVFVGPTLLKRMRK